MTQPISPKIHIPYIPNSKIPNAKRRKKKSRSPINPQGQESREKEISLLWVPCHHHDCFTTYVLAAK
jgi:hypothetical protein